MKDVFNVAMLVVAAAMIVYVYFNVTAPPRPAPDFEPMPAATLIVGE